WGGWSGGRGHGEQGGPARPTAPARPAAPATLGWDAIGHGGQPSAGHEGNGCHGRHRARDDGRRRTIVAGELDGPRPGVITAEAQEEAHLRATEPVNRLIPVTDHGQPTSVARE